MYDKANYKCVDYVPCGFGNAGFCRLLNYPCINGLRMGSCPRKFQDSLYCTKCHTFDNKHLVENGKIIHRPYINCTGDKGCGGEMVRREPDTWIVKCPQCGYVDKEPQKHECRKGGPMAWALYMTWTCPQCRTVQFTTSIAIYFKDVV